MRTFTQILMLLAIQFYTVNFHLNIASPFAFVHPLSNVHSIQSAASLGPAAESVHVVTSSRVAISGFHDVNFFVPRLSCNLHTCPHHVQFISFDLQYNIFGFVLSLRPLCLTLSGRVRWSIHLPMALCAVINICSSFLRLGQLITVFRWYQK